MCTCSELPSMTRAVPSTPATLVRDRAATHCTPTAHGLCNVLELGLAAGVGLARKPDRSSGDAMAPRTQASSVTARSGL